MPPRFDGVFFDLDGTLIDSRADISASVNHVREARGLASLPVEVVQTYVGDGVRLLIERALGTRDVAAVDAAISDWRAHYVAHCLDRTDLYPGVREMLGALARAGMTFGVVSNKPLAPSEMILSGLKIRDLFKVVIGGDSTPARKPDPEPLLLAAERAGVHPGRVLMVGDSPNDIEGARRAGCASCGVLWGIGPEEAVRGARPDYLARTPDEVCRAAGV